MIGVSLAQFRDGLCCPSFPSRQRVSIPSTRTAPPWLATSQLRRRGAHGHAMHGKVARCAQPWEDFGVARRRKEEVRAAMEERRGK